MRNGGTNTTIWRCVASSQMKPVHRDRTNNHQLVIAKPTGLALQSIA